MKLPSWAATGQTNKLGEKSMQEGTNQKRSLLLEPYLINHDTQRAIMISCSEWQREPRQLPVNMEKVCAEVEVEGT